MNKKTGDKMMLKPNGKGSYLMKVEFEGGGPTEIVVDSGAEENVCPKWWGEGFGLDRMCKTLNLRNASGVTIPHLRQREVLVESPF